MSRMRTTADAQRALSRLCSSLSDQRLGSRRELILRRYLTIVMRDIKARRQGAPIAAVLTLLGLMASASGAEGRWVQVVATAYSPHDAIDSEYHETKGADRWMTAHRVDVRSSPYGVAAPLPSRSPLGLPAGTRIYIPSGQGYLDETRANRVFMVDDTGGEISRRTERTGQLHLDLRYRTEASALRFERRLLWVYIFADGGADAR